MNKKFLLLTFLPTLVCENIQQVFAAQSFANPNDPDFAQTVLEHQGLDGKSAMYKEIMNYIQIKDDIFAKNEAVMIYYPKDIKKKYSITEKMLMILVQTKIIHHRHGSKDYKVDYKTIDCWSNISDLIYNKIEIWTRDGVNILRDCTKNQLKYFKVTHDTAVASLKAEDGSGGIEIDLTFNRNVCAVLADIIVYINSNLDDFKEILQKRPNCLLIDAEQLNMTDADLEKVVLLKTIFPILNTRDIFSYYMSSRHHSITDSNMVKTIQEMIAETGAIIEPIDYNKLETAGYTGYLDKLLNFFVTDEDIANIKNKLGNIELLIKNVSTVGDNSNLEEIMLKAKTNKQIEIFCNIVKKFILDSQNLTTQYLDSTKNELISSYLLLYQTRNVSFYRRIFDYVDMIMSSLNYVFTGKNLNNKIFKYRGNVNVDILKAVCVNKDHDISVFPVTIQLGKVDIKGLDQSLCEKLSDKELILCLEESKLIDLIINQVAKEVKLPETPSYVTAVTQTYNTTKFFVVGKELYKLSQNTYLLGIINNALSENYNLFIKEIFFNRLFHTQLSNDMVLQILKSAKIDLEKQEGIFDKLLKRLEQCDEILNTFNNILKNIKNGADVTSLLSAGVVEKIKYKDIQLNQRNIKNALLDIVSPIVRSFTNKDDNIADLVVFLINANATSLIKQKGSNKDLVMYVREEDVWKSSMQLYGYFGRKNQEELRIDVEYCAVDNCEEFTFGVLNILRKSSFENYTLVELIFNKNNDIDVSQHLLSVLFIQYDDMLTKNIIAELKEKWNICFDCDAIFGIKENLLVSDNTIQTVTFVTHDISDKNDGLTNYEYCVKEDEDYKLTAVECNNDGIALSGEAYEANETITYRRYKKGFQNNINSDLFVVDMLGCSMSRTKFNFILNCGRLLGCAFFNLRHTTELYQSLIDGMGGKHSTKISMPEMFLKLVLSIDSKIDYLGKVLRLDAATISTINKNLMNTWLHDILINKIKLNDFINSINAKIIDEFSKAYHNMKIIQKDYNNTLQINSFICSYFSLYNDKDKISRALEVFNFYLKSLSEENIKSKEDFIEHGSKTLNLLDDIVSNRRFAVVMEDVY